VQRASVDAIGQIGIGPSRRLEGSLPVDGQEGVKLSLGACRTF
jgi:hypothetical protein